jgi:hypothetical protein
MGSGVLDVKFDDKSIKQAKLETNCAIDEISRKSLQFSRYNLNKQKATCSQRLPGSGRKSYAELMNVPDVRFERKVLIRFLSLEVNAGPRNPFIFSFSFFHNCLLAWPFYIIN